jgi:DNA-binding response OmpR family regulator
MTTRLVAKQSTARSPGQTKRGDGMHILLVEDEPALQELWADVLRDHCYAVDLAGTLSEAQDCLRAQAYDLVITDWRLPDGDGCVVADWAAALGGKALVTSGYLSYMPGGVALGHETLMKPSRLSDLIAAVEGLIGKAPPH